MLSFVPRLRNTNTSCPTAVHEVWATYRRESKQHTYRHALRYFRACTTFSVTPPRSPSSHMPATQDTPPPVLLLYEYLHNIAISKTHSQVAPNLTHCAVAVAIAAPVTPRSHANISTGSSTRLTAPTTIALTRPVFGSPIPLPEHEPNQRPSKSAGKRVTAVYEAFWGTYAC